MMYFYLQYVRQHVSASKPAIFMVMFLDTRKQLSLNVSQSLNNIKIYPKLYYGVILTHLTTTIFLYQETSP